MNEYTIKYQFGTYSGTETVDAKDAEDALARVKLRLKRHMSLSMAHESYKVVSVRQVCE